MIFRTWHGCTRASDADAYETFLQERAAPDYRSVDGLINLYFTRRDDGDVSHFLLATIWRDEHAVRAFAGDDATRAKYYPEDDRFLLEKEKRALNHRVFHNADGTN